MSILEEAFIGGIFVGVITSIVILNGYRLVKEMIKDKIKTGLSHQSPVAKIKI